MLRHYVFLKYREGTSDGHVTAFCERMLALRATITGIEHLEIGRDELHDARSWDLVLIMEFASAEALRAYQRHPEHAAFAADGRALAMVAAAEIREVRRPPVARLWTVRPP